MSALPPMPGMVADKDDAVLRILLAEDDRMASLILHDILVADGHIVETAENGAQAYAMLREDPTRADVLLTDRFMPVLDGLGLTRRVMRERYTRHLPVIMLTAADDAASVAEGLEAGVMQYLAKPVDPILLREVLKVAGRQIAQRRELASSISAHQAGFANIQRVDFTLRTMSEIGPVASLLASLSEHAERILPALRELLANGLEHGLYGLGGEAKQTHLSAGTFEEEIARREADPGIKGHIEAAAQRIEGGLRYAIRDPGEGFAWRRYLRPDPAHGLKASGRGLVRAAHAFDELKFHGSGNLVTAIVSTRAKRVW